MMKVAMMEKLKIKKKVALKKVCSHSEQKKQKQEKPEVHSSRLDKNRSLQKNSQIKEVDKKMKDIQYKSPEELKLLTDKDKPEVLSLVKKLKRKKPLAINYFKINKIKHIYNLY